MSEKRKLEHIPGDGEVSYEGDERTLEKLAVEYSCGIDVKPEWCVYGGGHDSASGILHYIKPSPEAEFIARKMAQLTNLLGGHATAEKTEWNPTLEGTPIYKRLGKRPIDMLR